MDSGILVSRHHQGVQWQEIDSVDPWFRHRIGRHGEVQVPGSERQQRRDVPLGFCIWSIYLWDWLADAVR